MIVLWSAFNFGLGFSVSFFMGGSLIAWFLRHNIKPNMGGSELRKNSACIYPAEVMEQLSHDRISGELARSVTSAEVWYEASTTHTGLVDRVRCDDYREPGYFRDGVFVPVKYTNYAPDNG